MYDIQMDEKLLLCIDFRVNCLRFSRTTNASQKNKYKQLQSSWYFLLDKYCLLCYLPWLLFDFVEFKFTVFYDFPLNLNFVDYELQVRALHYLHSNRIIHRDMKPQNILIGAGSVVKVDSLKRTDLCVCVYL